MTRIIIRLILSLLVPTAAMALPAANLSAKETVDYEIARGDTLYDLANQHFVKPADWVAVARANAIANPRHLRVGSKLVIPKRYLRYSELNAELISFRGSLSIKSAAGAAQKVRLGLTVGEGAVISTARNSFASFQLGGAGTVALPSVTAVRIERLRRYSLGDHIERRIVIINGRMDVNASGARKNKDDEILQIRTRRATAAIRGTQFSISQTENADALSVHEGVVAFEAVQDSQETDAAPQGEEQALAVDAGFGSVARDSGIEGRVQLLPKTDLLQAGRVRTEKLARFEAAPIAGAATYRFTFGLDTSLIETIAEQESVDGSVEVPDLPDGTIYVRLSGVSADGVEGERRVYAVRRIFSEISSAASIGADQLTQFRWRSAGASGPARLILSADEDLGAPLVDLPNIETGEVDIKRLKPGTYYWAVEHRLVDNGTVERVRGPVQELIIPEPE